MTKEYHRDTDSTLVSFAAGSAVDAIGCPTPYWSCRVAYTWSEYRQAYWVYSLQVVGFGAVCNTVTRETTMESLREVNHLLGYYRDMEACYKKVYGE